MTLFINIFQEYRNAGYTVIETSSKQNKGINEIKEIFKDQVTVITGQVVLVNQRF